MEWQPIEMAPKDCPVLLWSKKYQSSQVNNFTKFEKHNHPQFTHWMPLPKPPSEEV